MQLYILRKAADLFMDENQIDGRCSHRRFISVFRFFCVIIDDVSLMDLLSSLKTRSGGVFVLVLQIGSCSDSKNRYELYYPDKLESVSVQRDRI